MFKNFEKLLYEIKKSLLSSADLKRLVFYNTPDALERDEPTYDEASQYIYIKPIIMVYEDSPEFGMSTFITIGFLEGVISEGKIISSIKISAVSDRKVWEIDNNRTRTLAMVSEIVNKTDQQKFSIAGKLNLKLVREVYLNNDLIGYTMLFDINEEKGDVINEF